MRSGGQSKTDNDLRKQIFTFLLMTFALSSVFYYFLINDGSLFAGHGLYILALMWCPGVSAFITTFLFKKKICDLISRLSF